MAWQSSDGQDHESQYDRDYYEEVNLGGRGGKSGPNATDGLVGLWGMGTITFIILVAIGFIIRVVVKQYTFYVLPIAVFFILFNFVTNGLKSLIALLVLIAAVAGCILFAKFIYYPNVVEPSPFTADYLVSEAAIHSQRNGKGKELALLPAGEKVTVNGITRDRAEFNITAKDGATGWIPAAAFPEDANVKPDDIGGLMKSWLPFMGDTFQSKFARDSVRRGDRDWFNSVEAVSNYFVHDDPGYRLPDTENGELYDDVWLLDFSHFERLKDNVVNRALKVNQPFTATVHGEHTDTLDFSDIVRPYGRKIYSGPVEATLRYVLYLPEVTIISIYPGDHEFAHEFGNDDSKESEYHKSLVLKDLDSGETFPLYREFDISISEAGEGEHLYMFPPVTTRHFALVHEKKNTLKKEYDEWDIPEIIVPANAPTMANDPFERALRRAVDFDGGGTTAMTTNNVYLYPEPIPDLLFGDAKKKPPVYPEPLAVIPPGEVVTELELEEDEPWSYYYRKVGYKDLEGWVNRYFLKYYN